MRAVIGDRVYICQGIDLLPEGCDFRRFEPNRAVSYQPFCDDFGPMGMSSVIHFIQQLDSELESFPSCMLFYCIDRDRRSLTNAVFLLGAYMILRLGQSESAVSECFEWANDALIQPYRDATYARSDFDLCLADCWRALVKGMGHGWIDVPSELDYLWGDIDVDEYSNYDDPLNGDLHEVVPGKFVAFKGPRDLGGREYEGRAGGSRDFSPEFYVDTFQELGVRAVVRLNQPEYDARGFSDRGIAVHELEFEDCTAPPPAVADAFLRLADAATGALAVHCKAGLGRTGTLIALWLMRRRGFAAREAIAWLRIMRPGSVLGEQQHFLVATEQADHAMLRSAPAGIVAKTMAASPPDGEGRQCRDLASQIAGGAERRAAALAQARRKPFPETQEVFGGLSPG
jgi:cell division cycle 14